MPLRSVHIDDEAPEESLGSGAMLALDTAVQVLAVVAQDVQPASRRVGHHGFWLELWRLSERRLEAVNRRCGVRRVAGPAIKLEIGLGPNRTGDDEIGVGA